MALRNSPLAIDGALIDAATLRIESFMSGGRYGGVSAPGALKVRALAIPGNGVRIAEGAATVPNGYQSEPDQAYVASNVGEHVVPSSAMPPANASARSHLVVVTVGDPEFSQAGHPWMLVSDPPEGEELTFQYVRFHIIQNVPASTKRFSDLGLSYPAYELARLDIPANTTTITQEMIVDLREVEEIPYNPGVILGTPGNAYKRKNCRLVDGVDTPDGTCAAALTSPGGYGAGVDLNRNYGGFWGGPGASATFADPTYRGTEPFSEPEIQNVRELVSGRQVTTLITNHTFSNLVLRPNGVNPTTIGPDGLPVGDAPDEDAMKELGARIGPALEYSQLKSRTQGMSRSESYRYATRIVEEART